MELKDFVARSLTDIIKGVSEAQAAIQTPRKDLGGQVNPRIDSTSRREIKGRLETQDNYQPVQMVEFDIAVTVSEGSGEEGKGGIRVLSIIDVGGKIDSKRENVTVSRMKFSVPVSFPIPDEGNGQ